jgi:ribosomal protein L11 methyltransferase
VKEEEYYYELSVTTSDLSLFSDLLFELTDNAVEERDDSVIVRSSEPLEDIEWAVKEFAKKLNLSIETNLTKKESIDWIKRYQNSINPIEVGEFYIRASWHKKREDLIDIIIDPALAFGSGHHETTSSILKVLPKYVKEGVSLFDVGCGSGILSIAAAKKGAIVDLCDTDPLSIESAKKNFSLNDVTYGEAFMGSASKSDKKYDIVVANIIADVIIFIKNDLKNRLKVNSVLILSGIIENYFDKIVDNFSEFEVLENIKEGEWHTLVLRKV